eukprot:4011192-Prymnesium_polylepis.1
MFGACLPECPRCRTSLARSPRGALAQDLAFMGKGAPHVGFPEAALAKYAEKFVSLGYKVGVVEQMETPQQVRSVGRGGTAAAAA